MGFSDQLFNFFHDNKGLPIRSMTVFNFLLEASLCGALLILLVLLVRWLLRRKLGSRILYVVWLLVAIRLLVPVALPNPWMNDLRPTLSTDAEARPIADQIRVRFQDATSDLAWAIDSDHVLGKADKAYTLSRFVQDISAYTSYGWTGKWFLFAYLAVDGLILCGMVAWNIRFRRRLKKHRKGQLTGEAMEKYRGLCETCKVKPLPVYFVDSLEGACLVGVLKPYIALPADQTDPSFALTHELCHYKAHDEWWSVLRSLCCIVHWFNPLVWIGAHCARTDSEFACDERAGIGMADDVRQSYADALEHSAAKKNSPGILILSTEITIRSKGLKRRSSFVLNSGRPSKWAIVAFATLAALVLLGSFFTAESYGSDYNLTLQKSIYGNLLDSPFPEADEVFNRTTVTVKPITSSAEAIEQANLYLNTDFLGNVALARTDQRYSVYHAVEGWYVAATSYADETYCFLLGDDGRLLRYNSRVFNDQVLVNNGRLPSNIDQAMASYMNAFAVDCLGQSGATNPAINEDQYNVEGRYLACQADIGGKTCGFLFCVAPYPRLLQFYSPVTPSVSFTQENVLYSLWVYSRDVLGLTAEQRKTSCDFTVEWLEDKQRWYGTVRIPAYAVSESTLSKLQSLYGTREIYTLQMECDTDGNGSDQLTALAVAEKGNGSNPVTTKVTTTYFDAADQWLYEEETIQPGTPYTVLRTFTPEENHFDQDWAKGHTWLWVQYQSPAYGGVITRWMLSLNEAIAVEPGVTLGEDGRPVGWRSASLPDSFWDTMEQMGGGDWTTASVLLQNWQNKYGESIATWPLEGQALWGLWMNSTEGNDSEISALPESGDLSMDKALGIARSSFEASWVKTYPDQKIPDSLSPLVSFHYDMQQNGRRIWYVQYVDQARKTGEYCGDVLIDAQTGEVLLSEAILGSNG